MVSIFQLISHGLWAVHFLSGRLKKAEKLYQFVFVAWRQAVFKCKNTFMFKFVFANMKIKSHSIWKTKAYYGDQSY